MGSFGARGRDTVADVRWQGSGLSCLCIQANGGQKCARGNLLGILIDHFVSEEKDLRDGTHEGKSISRGLKSVNSRLPEMRLAL